MGDTHAAQAQELAVEAEKIMRKAIELEDQGKVNAFAASGVGGNKWQRVQALQAQAQVHATLALAEATARAKIGE
jgi:hypothetical protein